MTTRAFVLVTRSRRRPHRIDSRRRRSSSAAALCFLALTGTACGVVPTRHLPDEDVHAPEDIAASEQQIRIRMRSLVQPLSGVVVESADRIAAEATDRAVRRAALLWKIEAVPALREALFRADPLAAVVDAWVLAWQMTDWFETGAGKEALGDAAPDAARACRELEARLAEVAASLTTSGDVSVAREFARRWAGEHPVLLSIGSRESTASRVTEREIRETLSTSEIAGNALVSLDDLARRMDVYGAQLFEQGRWQAQLIAMDLELDRAMPQLETGVRTASEAVAVARRLEPALNDALAVARSAPDTFARERALALEFVAAERAEALAELGRTIASERAAVLESVTLEREAAMAELRRTIAEERAGLVDDATEAGARLVDRAMLRAAQLVAATLVVAFVGIVLLLFATRRIFAARDGG